jgi:small GTP-binding protein
MSDETINCKIVIVGESSVGKTCILRSFLGEEFQEEHVSTMSAETEKKDIIVNDEKVKVSISDTAGQEMFRAITKMYYKGADIVIIVYDITNEKTFTEIKKYWMNEVFNNSTDLKGKKENFFIFFSYWNIW